MIGGVVLYLKHLTSSKSDDSIICDHVLGLLPSRFSMNRADPPDDKKRGTSL